MYQKVYCSNISNSIIKDMKFDLRNKLRKNYFIKARHKLGTSCYWGL